MRALSLSLSLSLSLAACGASPVASRTPDDDAAPRTSEAPAPAPTSSHPILDAHNARRAAHCAPPLAWSDALAATAQHWADHLASSGCALEHSSGSLGENLAAGTSGTLSPTDVVDMWYAEGAHYDFAHGDFGMDTGHFTQLVWTSSTTLGCGTASCGGLDIWVCNYDPPGNYEGEFQAHVLPTSCR
jgi:uncharacterized protein YkwD